MMPPPPRPFFPKPKVEVGRFEIESDTIDGKREH